MATAVPKQRLVHLYREAVAAGIPLDEIEEKVAFFSQRSMTTEAVESTDDLIRERALKAKAPLMTKIAGTVMPFVFIILGLFLVGNAVWPIASYYIFTEPNLETSRLLAPIPHQDVLDVMPKVVAQATTNSGEVLGSSSPSDQIQTKILKEDLDYSNLANWFTSTNMTALNQEQNDEYILDIPELDIQNAKVHIGGSNLDKNLIQYPGTALPGQLGSAVIFGHSVLRQFYNPQEKNPRRYFSIFSKIMTLKDGDPIYVTHDNVKYTYKVREKSVVQPEDTFILDQRYDSKQLKLVTCVPEGTYLQRGVVTADLAN